MIMIYQSPPNLLKGQIGYVSYPDGVFRPVTRDNNSYSTLTASSDFRTLATVEIHTSRMLYFLPATGTPDTSPSPAPVFLPQFTGFLWDGEGALLFFDGQNFMQIDGAGDRKTLTSDARALLITAEPCGKPYVVAEWAFHGGANEPEVWRLSIDGSAPLQLASGAANIRPFCSPDGKWVYYTERVTNRIMSVSINGGKSEIVPGTAIPDEFFDAAPVALSPDGSQMPFVVGVPPARIRIRMVTLDAGPHPPKRTLTPDPRSSGSFVRFTPDGKSVAYSILENGVENLWVQPLDGSAGKQITNFKTGSISDFRWSPDGKTLGLVRAETQSDIVLLRDRTNP